jgi:trimeric autotransporter adhesin
MKTKLSLNAAIALLSLTTLVTHPTALAQGTVFTYQGRLNDNGNPANGSYDLQFYLRDAAVAGNAVGNTNTLAPVAVSNGVFTVNLDFGAAPFATGANRWLEIGVRPNGSIAPYSTLAPRQAITATPYAITASNLTGPVPAAQLTGTIGSAQLSGTYSSMITLNNPANVFAGDGSGLINVNAGLLGGLSASQFWKLAGNGGTTAGVNFLGTTDNQPLELKAAAQRVLRLEPNVSSGAPNFIAGSQVNRVMAGTVGAVIGGGGATNYLQVEPALSGYYVVGSNHVAADFGTISGGGLNLIAPGSTLATIGGGALNTIQTNARNSVIGGGLFNTIGANAAFATVGGGLLNSAQGIGSFIGGGGYDGIFSFAGNTNAGNASVIGGGTGNYILVGNDWSALGGGLYNQIGLQSGMFSVNTFGAAIGGGSLNTNAGSYSSIPGGYRNAVNGQYAFAGGRRAKANFDGDFVWADSTDADFAVGTTNSFSARASGGVNFYSSANLSSGVFLPAGGNSWAAVSDRDAKENFREVDPREILAKVAALPVLNYNMKTQDKAIRHLGPMAQDFHAAFQLGEDEKHITTVDADGVALAAIQGLNQKLEDSLKQRDAENLELKKTVAELKELVQALSQKMNGGSR